MDDALLTSLDCDLQCSAETFQTDYEEDGKSLDLCEGGAAATSGAVQIRVIAQRTVGSIRLWRCCFLRVHLIEEKDFKVSVLKGKRKFLSMKSPEISAIIMKRNDIIRPNKWAKRKSKPRPNFIAWIALKWQPEPKVPNITKKAPEESRPEWNRIKQLERAIPLLYLSLQERVSPCLIGQEGKCTKLLSIRNQDSTANLSRTGDLNLPHQSQRDFEAHLKTIETEKSELVPK